MENVLFVAAVDAEASHVPEGAPLLITGIGTVPAAIELTNALASAEVLPEFVVWSEDPAGNWLQLPLNGFS